MARSCSSTSWSSPPAAAAAPAGTCYPRSRWRANVTPDTVDARDNWWGDPAGPLGPGGDGVAGNVVYEPWRSEPVPLNAQAIQNDARARSQSSRIASMSASMVAKRWMSRSRAWKSMRTSSP
jgi:hypothetical protein